VRSFVPADAPVIPLDYVQDLFVEVLLYPRRKGVIGSGNVTLAARLSLHDATFGKGSEGEATTSIGERQYRLHAALAPREPRPPEPSYRKDEYAGTLSLRVEDDLGNHWERGYAASGAIGLEADRVAAPYGLEIPGKSSPSKEWDARYGTLPGWGPYSVIDVAVQIELHDDPRQSDR
jgi:hypothetical protein